MKPEEAVPAGDATESDEEQERTPFSIPPLRAAADHAG